MSAGAANDKDFKASPVSIRRAAPADAEACGRICFEAFHSIATAHGFPPDIPSPQVATGVLYSFFSHPGFYSVVAESGGRILGSNCLDERNPIAGIGPITVDPSAQNHNVGRQLMHAVLDRVAEKKFLGTRLVQAAFHNRSLSLYTKLGFAAREPLSCVQGPPIGRKIAGYVVRPAHKDDLAACHALCVRVHGHDRSGELRDGIASGSAVVAERDGSIAAYAASMAFFGYGVARHNEAMMALIAAAPAFAGPGILIPTRNAELFCWCLESGLRVVQPMTLMSIGLYNEPTGAWFASVTY